MGGIGTLPDGLGLPVAIAIGAVLFYVLCSVRAMRETIRNKIGLFVRGYGLFLLLVYFLPRLGATQTEAFVGGLVAAAVVILAAPKRSRYIPAAAKRKVIARDLKGKRYDPKKHHIDHVWPYALGGSNTVDNLRVISKEKNLRKGAKKPSFWDWF